jgi:hypothetical protein
MSELIPIGKVAALCPSRVSTNTVWRWMRRGVLARNGQRVRLWHCRCGGKLFSSEQALTHFFQETADADAIYFVDKPVVPTNESTLRRGQRHRSAKARAKAVAAANATLAKAGI